MNIIADTNLLIRMLVLDDLNQARQAAELFEKADTVVVSPLVFCEMAWVLKRGYAVSNADIKQSIETFLATEKVETDRGVVQFGLSLMASGGDFADGVIAASGRVFGGEVFASFDKMAVRSVKAMGIPAIDVSQDLDVGP